MKFEVVIDTDEATAEELEDAIKFTLRIIDFENGDQLFVDNPNVEYIE